MAEPATVAPLVATGVYVVGIGAWLLVWRLTEGFHLMTTRIPLLWLPFVLAILFLFANGVLTFAMPAIGSAAYEESRFVFIGERAQIAIQALASILIVSTIVYGLTIKRLPIEFVRFMVHAVIAILGIMAPILWIPDGFAEAFFILRHVQNSALTAGLFLILAGVVVLLHDLLTKGASLEDDHAPSGGELTGGNSDPDDGTEQVGLPEARARMLRSVLGLTRPRS